MVTIPAGLVHCHQLRVAVEDAQLVRTPVAVAAGIRRADGHLVAHGEQLLRRGRSRSPDEDATVGDGVLVAAGARHQRTQDQRISRSHQPAAGAHGTGQPLPRSRDRRRCAAALRSAPRG